MVSEKLLVFIAVVGVGLAMFLWGIDKLGVFERRGKLFRRLKGMVGVYCASMGLCIIIAALFYLYS